MDKIYYWACDISQNSGEGILANLFLKKHINNKKDSYFVNINSKNKNQKKNNFSKNKNLIFSNDISNACKNADLIIIHTEWEEFKALDFKKLNKKRNFKIYDMRNLYSPESMKKKGLNYYSIGRSYL